MTRSALMPSVWYGCFKGMLSSKFEKHNFSLYFPTTSKPSDPDTFSLTGRAAMLDRPPRSTRHKRNPDRASDLVTLPGCHVPSDFRLGSHASRCLALMITGLSTLRFTAIFEGGRMSTGHLQNKIWDCIHWPQRLRTVALLIQS